MSEFKPYGEEWEKEVMKANKGFIVDLYRNVCIKNKALEKQVEELKKGVCPKCGISMFDEFSFSIHSVANCGKRKAVAQNTEFA